MTGYLAAGSAQPATVRDWMQPNPLTTTGDTLVSEAKRLISEHRLHALPVVDGPRLRGLVTRANLLRMGHFVLHTQDPDEFNFFVTRLQVKDIMVRKPATVQAGDSMEHCLALGRQLGVAQFPVLDGEQLVGVISANEIFQLAAHCLADVQHHSAATPPGLWLARAQGEDRLPTPSRRADAGAAQSELLLRFSTRNTASVLNALESAGFVLAGPTQATPGNGIAAGSMR